MSDDLTDEEPALVRIRWRSLLTGHESAGQPVWTRSDAERAVADLDERYRQELVHWVAP